MIQVHKIERIEEVITKEVATPIGIEAAVCHYVLTDRYRMKPIDNAAELLAGIVHTLVEKGLLSESDLQKLLGDAYRVS